MAADEALTADVAAGGWIVYAQDKDNEVSFEDWLQRYRPSRAELKHFDWISVQASGRPKQAKTEDDLDKMSEDSSKLQSSATQLAAELAEKITAIESDPNIPVRGKKATAKAPAVKSKKDTREAEHEIVKNRLKNLSIDSKLTSGKWMFFPLTESVDGLWSKIAKAVINEDGALRGKAYNAKVSPFRPGDGEKPATHVICLYVEDSWNKDQVGDVFKTLVKEVGVVPTSYKADIYTYAGIDSKHASKMRSTLYGKYDFMSKEEIDAVFEAKKPAAPAVVKKQAKGTDFIESDDDDDEEKPKSKKSKK